MKQIGLSLLGLSALLILVFVFGGCNISGTGKAKIIETHAESYAPSLDMLEVDCPYGYHFIEWQLSEKKSGEKLITNSNRTKCRKFSGSFQVLNSFIENNELDIDSLNRQLETMQTEQPYLIRMRRYGKESEKLKTSYYFIMFSKERDTFSSDKYLLKVTDKYLKEKDLTSQL